MNTQTDMLAIANIKNVNRYFKMPDPQPLQQLLSAPKEPDAMTLAAQAQYQKVKADAAQALGDQNIRKAQQDQDNALAMAQLREKTLNDQAKLDLQRQQLEAQHSQSMAQMANQHTQALGKMAADIFKTDARRRSRRPPDARPGGERPGDRRDTQAARAASRG